MEPVNPPAAGIQPSGVRERIVQPCRSTRLHPCGGPTLQNRAVERPVGGPARQVEGGSSRGSIRHGTVGGAGWFGYRVGARKRGPSGPARGAAGTDGRTCLRHLYPFPGAAPRRRQSTDSGRASSERRRQTGCVAYPEPSAGLRAVGMPRQFRRGFLSSDTLVPCLDLRLGYWIAGPLAPGSAGYAAGLPPSSVSSASTRRSGASAPLPIRTA